MPKSIQKLKPLEINVLKDLDGFGEGKWRQVGTQIEPNVDLNSIAIDPNYNKTNNFFMIFEVLRDEVGSQDGAKFKQKNSSK